MRNALPPRGPFARETAILNLDDSENPGTHWVAYKKYGNRIMYFDSFGDLQPPVEFFDYIGGGGGSVKYNYKKYQNYDTTVCGHLCLKFLCNQLNRTNDFSLYKHSS